MNVVILPSDTTITFALTPHRALTVGHDYLLRLYERSCFLIDTRSAYITTYTLIHLIYL